jgi:hypothetical protein
MQPGLIAVETLLFLRFRFRKCIDLFMYASLDDIWQALTGQQNDKINRE